MSSAADYINERLSTLLATVGPSDLTADEMTDMVRILEGVDRRKRCVNPVGRLTLVNTAK